MTVTTIDIPPAPPGAPHVLVADDDPDILFLVRLKLGRAGYRVSAVADGRAALDAALAERYDVLILDWMMPVLTGLEVCRELRGKGVTAPIVLLTAKAGPDDIALAYEAGVTDYVTKPFSPHAIADHVAALLVAAG